MKNNDISPVLVSIKCLVYNHEPYLRKCLDGFVMQKTNFRFEAIVHDDASTDGSAAIIREYAEKYPDIIKPIYQTENQYSKGEDGHMGTDILNAYSPDSKYLAYCEGDDYWIDPLKLQKQVEILEKDKNVSMVYSNFETVDQCGVFYSRPKYERMMNRSFTGDIFASLLCRGNFVLTCTVCIRREVFELAIYKRQNISKSLDYSIFLSAAICGVCAHLTEKTAAYRQNPQSITNTSAGIIGKAIVDIKSYFFANYLNGEIEKRKCIDDLRIRLSAVQHAQRNGIIQDFLKINKKLVFLYPLAALEYCYKRITKAIKL